MKILLNSFLLSLLFNVSAVAMQSTEQQDTSETVAAQESEMSEEERQYMEWATGIWENLNKQTGEITIQKANATLNVPESFYFLNSKDAETVLVDVWGNPPGQNVLGMLLPSEQTPFDTDSWAVTIEYEEDGYVSDEDANDIDYSELLVQMQEDTRLASQDRIEQGYGSIELIGWAASPFYDATSNKLHWAKEIKFNGGEANTLNYNIRILGRKGVLVLNFIAGMDQLPMINSNLDTVLALAEFDTGSKYGDFNPDLDEVAAYGVGALVAGKVIAKTGFLAIALMFLKKFGVFIVIGLGALMKKLFFSKKETQPE